jgi:ribosomal protein S20
MQKKTTEGGASQDEKSVRALVSAVDKAAKRGIIHRNAANRRKARLNRARVGKATPVAAAAAKAPASDAS